MTVRINRRALILLCVCSVLLWLAFLWHEQLSLTFDGTDTELVNRNAQPQKSSLERKKGLSAVGDNFKIDGQPVTILSGAVHYFRVPRVHWEDRLMKMKYCGLNTVETYVPWNAHEPMPEVYDFAENLDLVEFIKLAHKLGLYVILRPGPYICSEWEFGGLPSWLLRDQVMTVRTMYKPYIVVVERYFRKLLPMVVDLQYSNGGPIIAFQIENEYGSYYEDERYVPFLKTLMQEHGIKELLFTSDNSEGLFKPSIPGVLKTVNFKNVGNHFKDLKSVQRNAPLMVMEYWTGWFDFWGEEHHTMSVQEYSENLNQILSLGASVNFYMFHGGTNFGFMNGANRDGKGFYQADITSYDYDAVIAENGDLTKKFHKTREIIEQYFPSQFEEPVELPPDVTRVAYSSVSTTKCVPVWETLQFSEKESYDYPVSMEMLSVNNKAGQSYGYTLYRTTLNFLDKKFVVKGLSGIHDRASFFVNKQKKLFYSKSQDRKNEVEITSSHDEEGKINLDILVENGGRINWHEFDNQRKGITGDLLVNGSKHKGWDIYALEMKKSFIEKLTKSTDAWQNDCKTGIQLASPNFYIFNINVDTPHDTYIDMTSWKKGVVFVNGQNLGRYWSIGPQYKLYLPSSWLYEGENQVIVFEEMEADSELKFSKDP